MPAEMKEEIFKYVKYTYLAKKFNLLPSKLRFEILKFILYPFHKYYEENVDSNWQEVLIRVLQILSIKINIDKLDQYDEMISYICVKYLKEMTSSHLKGLNGNAKAVQIFDASERDFSTLKELINLWKYKILKVNSKIISILLNATINLHLNIYHCNRFLCWAVAFQDAEVVEIFFKNICDFNLDCQFFIIYFCDDERGCTALDKAASVGSKEMVEIILEFIKKFDASSQIKIIEIKSLLSAYENGHSKIVKLILHRLVELYDVDQAIGSRNSYAKQRKYCYKLFKLILSHPRLDEIELPLMLIDFIFLKIKDYRQDDQVRIINYRRFGYEDTFLIEAIQNGLYRTVDKTLNHISHFNQDVQMKIFNFKDKFGRNFLISAVLYGQVKIVKLLLNHISQLDQNKQNIIFNTTTNWGTTVLDAAKRNPEILKLIQDAMAKIQARCLVS